MPPPPATLLEPRKSPVQARSSASVEAILEATVQVLLQLGKEKLTTTRVAARAGVSVGTLYQYFPNKRALLQAALKLHLGKVSDAIETVCREERGQPLERMATRLVSSFLAAKMEDVKESVALYSVGSDVDGAKIAHQIGLSSNRAITEMLETAHEPLVTDPQLAATMLQGAMFGVSRRLLESGDPEKHLESLRRELIFLACTYLQACAARPPE